MDYIVFGQRNQEPPSAARSSQVRRHKRSKEEDKKNHSYLFFSESLHLLCLKICLYQASDMLVLGYFDEYLRPLKSQCNAMSLIAAFPLFGYELIKYMYVICTGMYELEFSVNLENAFREF